MGMNLTFDLNEMIKLELALRRVEKVPQKAVSKAAGKGTSVVRKAIRGKVPVGETGQLKRGIIRSREKKKVNGKVVYDLLFDPAKNDIFQKPIKNPGEAGGNSDHGYYPASMEWGFLTRSKGGGLSYVPGYHFMRKATEESSSAVEHETVATMVDELVKELRK